MSEENSAMSNSEILVVPAPNRATPVSGERGLGWQSGDRGFTDIFGGPVKLNAEKISDNLRSFVESVNVMMSRLPAIGEPFRLEEIELTVELNAEGNFQLVGGAKVGLTGGLTLTLKRKSKADSDA